MKIHRMKIENYKCFKDSGWIELAEHLNVIVGQNNAGKTSLAEAFHIERCQNKPHRSLEVPRNLAPPVSKISVEVSVSGEELSTFVRQRELSVEIPVISIMDRAKAVEFVSEFLQREKINFRLRASEGNLRAIAYPSHSLFQMTGDAHSFTIKSAPDKQSIVLDKLKNGKTDGLPGVLREMLQYSVYVFKAERLNVGKTAAQQTGELTPNCDNLPAVLFNLSGNISRYRRLNAHVSEIFPTIRWVAVFPSGNELEIRIWSVDVESEREDLAMPLSEGGTGIGQVLAILYVAMTKDASTIVIDEPNSFLHPGAAKKLIQILKTYPRHQYVVSTHSPELISAIDPQNINFLEWKGGASTARSIVATEIAGMRGVLGDLGVSLADVFGYDKIIWVEGPTEQECFPKLMKAAKTSLPLGTGFVAVKQVGDFESRRNNPKLIVEIYNQLAKRSPLVPTASVFSFDRERRTNLELQKLKEWLGGAVRFLPRATYENYLLHPDAISAVLAQEGVTFSGSDVTGWFEVRGIDLDDGEVTGKCDAPAHLSELFTHASASKLEYRKTSHSIALTEWLLEHRPHSLAELQSYVNGLVEMLN